MNCPLISRLLLLIAVAVFSPGGLSGQIPLYEYHFSGTLNENGGGPTLTEVGAGLSAFGTTSLCSGPADDTYVWPQGRGLRLDVPVNYAVYSVEIWFSLTTTSGYRRILDYSGLTLDCGLYTSGGPLTLYCVGGSGGTVSTSMQHLVVTRDGANQYTCFLNGCQVMTVNDAGGQSIITSANDLIFFKDNGTEESGGSCAQIRFYNSALTPANVVTLYNAVCPSVGSAPPPGVMTYDFSLSTLAEQTMGGPTLTELFNSTPADGYFTTGTPCGFSQVVYEFPTNAGLQWNNTAAGNFLYQNHTVELFMEFDNLASWKRILDYSNRTQDQGVYAFNSQIQFYNFGTSATFPFSPNVWAHVVLVRRKGITACMDSTYYDMYVDGALRLSLTNTGLSSMPTAANMLSFFQDDLVIGNEASSGSTAFLRIYNFAMTSAQALFAYNNRCTVLLPDKQIELTAHPGDKQVDLHWQAPGLNPGIQKWRIEYSGDGNEFSVLAELPATEFQFTDARFSRENTWYRVSILEENGQRLYSNTVFALQGAPVSWTAFPNPTTGVLTVWGAGPKAGFTVTDSQGRQFEVKSEYQSAAWIITLPESCVPGIYFLHGNGEGNPQTLRIVLMPAAGQ